MSWKCTVILPQQRPIRCHIRILVSTIRSCNLTLWKKKSVYFAFFFHVNICLTVSWMSILVHEQRSGWLDCLAAVNPIPSVGIFQCQTPHRAGKNTHSFATVLLPWIMPLIDTSQQCQQSLRLHCYWFNSKTLKAHRRSEWESDRWRVDNLAQRPCRLNFQSGPSVFMIVILKLYYWFSTQLPNMFDLVCIHNAHLKQNNKSIIDENVAPVCGGSVQMCI